MTSSPSTLIFAAALSEMQHLSSATFRRSPDVQKEPKKRLTRAELLKMAIP
jgi:hypothetical protein